MPCSPPHSTHSALFLHHRLGYNRNNVKNWPEVLLHPPVASYGFFLLTQLDAALVMVLGGAEIPKGIAGPGWHHIHLAHY